MSKADRVPLNDEQEEVVQNTDPPSDPETDPTTGADGDSVTTDPQAELPAQDALTRTRAELTAAIDRMARMQAEFDNARKRAQKEQADAREYAAARILEQLLPIMDNFALALKAEGSAEQLRAGVELIYRQMEDVLRQAGVQPIETIGAPFDPRHHEALGHVETTEHPSDHVAEEIRRGYKFKERLLRPAMVRVAAAPVGAGERSR